ncbi:MAG: PDZ domain-containing protein [Acidobacteria bacterium]|nr:PDZ domain-containing protein [Acidobacteriota bacterium]MBV9069039.1 PDZ domain-containing protein [Acidobacteriota bacterium]MBV9184165.1 PDZ domain-containing protein [Acidobacteriota bacterium]
MIVRLSHLLLAALLFISTAHAEERKMCTAPASECEKAIRELSSGRRYLGVKIKELEPGIIVETVIDEGPAARADLRVGDRLMSVNGHSIVKGSIKDFKQILYSAKDTGVLWIIVLRQGILKKVDVRLEPYTKAQIDKMVAQHLAQAHGISSINAAAPQQ